MNAHTWMEEGYGRCEGGTCNGYEGPLLQNKQGGPPSYRNHLWPPIAFVANIMQARTHAQEPPSSQRGMQSKGIVCGLGRAGAGAGSAAGAASGAGCGSGCGRDCGLRCGRGCGLGWSYM